MIAAWFCNLHRKKAAHPIKHSFFSYVLFFSEYIWNINLIKIPFKGVEIDRHHSRDWNFDAWLASLKIDEK